MTIRKVLSISVVSVASLLVIWHVAIAAFWFSSTHGASQQNFAPTEGQQLASPLAGTVVFSQKSGGSSFLYRREASSTKPIRLTSASNGIESEPSFSHDGKFIAYSFASASDSKSAVWVVGADGGNRHAASGKDEDALHPVFSPDDSKIFYAVSNFTGNHSPIVRPARHDWDIFAIPVRGGSIISGSTTQITHGSFYDMQSLDVAADGLSPVGTKLLISITGYPIGALIEEFNLGGSGRDKIFQPHVPGESSIGPSYGEARFTQDGMGILFLAATDTSSGTYNYNVYSMSDVTGSEVKRLTNLKGMTKELRLLPGGKATFVNDGVVYVLDLSTQRVQPL